MDPGVKLRDDKKKKNRDRYLADNGLLQTKQHIRIQSFCNYLIYGLPIILGLDPGIHAFV